MSTQIPSISSSDSTTTTSTSSTGSSATSAAQTTKDQFMKLFIAQLQNQDPLSPQDSSAFLAQLAQMSQLEQTTETNDKLQSLVDAQTAASRASLTNMVGHRVTASADSLEVRDGSAPLGATGPQLSVHTDAPAKQLELDVLDASGTTIKVVNLGASAGGDVAVDPAKLGSLPAGSLKLVVKGKAADGTVITGSAQVTGTVDALQIGSSGGQFRIGPFNVSPANVMSVGAVAP